MSRNDKMGQSMIYRRGVDNASVVTYFVKKRALPGRFINSNSMHLHDPCVVLQLSTMRDIARKQPKDICRWVCVVLFYMDIGSQKGV
jgi:hypothetical protein